MSTCVRSVRFELRRNTSTAWTNSNIILLAGEPGVEIDTGQMKIGDGVNLWSVLPYVGIPAQGATGPTGPGGAIYLSTARLNLAVQPTEGSILSDVTTAPNLAYSSGNSILFTGPTGSFEGIVKSYTVSGTTGYLDIQEITDIYGTVTGPILFTINLTGTRGTLFFYGPGSAGPSGRVGDFYIDSNTFVLYRLI